LSTGLTGSGQSIIALGVTNLVDGLTLIRVRGTWTVEVDVIPTLATNFFKYALGLCIVTEQAFAVGATALPGPLSENDWDGWLWHHQGIAGAVPQALSNIGAGRISAVPVDTKAMRKQPQGMVLIGMVEVDETGVAGTFRSELESRMLSKLP